MTKTIQIQYLGHIWFKNSKSTPIDKINISY